MNKLIVTKYIGPTNFKGSRIKAQFADSEDSGYSITIPYPLEQDGVNAHQEAADALLEKVFKGFLDYRIVDIVSVLNGYGFVVTPSAQGNYND